MLEGFPDKHVENQLDTERYWGGKEEVSLQVQTATVKMHHSSDQPMNWLMIIVLAFSGRGGYCHRACT